jgi:hypothetical protein
MPGAKRPLTTYGELNISPKSKAMVQNVIFSCPLFAHHKLKKTKSKIIWPGNLFPFIPPAVVYDKI